MVTWFDRASALFFIPLVSTAAVAIIGSDCVQNQLKCGIPVSCYRIFITLFLIFGVIFIIQQLYFLQLDTCQLRVEANPEILKACGFAQL